MMEKVVEIKAENITFDTPNLPETQQILHQFLVQKTWMII